MTRWFASRAVLRFFATGELEWSAPLLGIVLRETLPQAPRCIDFWGVNFYSR